MPFAKRLEPGEPIIFQAPDLVDELHRAGAFAEERPVDGAVALDKEIDVAGLVGTEHYTKDLVCDC